MRPPNELVAIQLFIMLELEPLDTFLLRCGMTKVFRLCRNHLPAGLEASKLYILGNVETSATTADKGRKHELHMLKVETGLQLVKHPETF